MKNRNQIEFVLELHEHGKSNFLDLKFISTKTFSIASSDVYLFKILLGVSSRTRSDKPCLTGKELSSFVSEIKNMPILLLIIFSSISNLFLREFIFKWPVINRLGFVILISRRTFSRFFFIANNFISNGKKSRKG